jgi:hypothetical protein
MGLPRVEPGEPIRAKDINALFEAAEGLSLTADGLEVAKTMGGTALAVRRPWAGWLKITSGSNPYSGTEQIARSAGTWVDGARTVSGGAYETNGNTSVPGNTIVWAYHDPASGTIIFTY